MKTNIARRGANNVSGPSGYVNTISLSLSNKVLTLNHLATMGAHLHWTDACLIMTSVVPRGQGHGKNWREYHGCHHVGIDLQRSLNDEGTR